MEILTADHMASSPISVRQGNHADVALAVAERLRLPHESPLCVVNSEAEPLRQRIMESLAPDAPGAGPADFVALVAEDQAKKSTPHPSALPTLRHGPDSLIVTVLELSTESGARVGFLGGAPRTREWVETQFLAEHPGLTVAGCWSPNPAHFDSDELSRAMAEQIRRAKVDVLFVGDDVPHRELWMAHHAAATGAAVVLGFAPITDVASSRNPATRTGGAVTATAGRADGSFSRPGEPADIMVCVVSYNSADALPGLIASLREEARSIRLRVVVADNDSADGTLDVLAGHPDVLTLPTGGNLGYASGINTTMRLPMNGEDMLVINPDIVVEKGAITALHRRLLSSNAAIVVPRLLESDGSVYLSLRREPSIVAAFGDALFGGHFPTRPKWLSEIDFRAGNYGYPHQIDWATGASMLIRADMVARIGDWDEQFFLYSEEVDYFRRVREAGGTIWYEPAATMTHAQGGSGSSSKLDALMAVNRIRYVRKHRDRRYAAWFRGVVVLSEALRCFVPSHRGLLATVLDENSWDALPGPTAQLSGARALERFPVGSVIIPAHNEAAVIARTLQQLKPVVESGMVEVIVACNGCTDATARIAREFQGVHVLQVDEASKTAALNAADAAATLWPRLYLDADIEISPAALRMVFDRVGNGGLLAARPAFRYDDSGATWPVKAFYRARRRIPSTRAALWGSGAYALSKEGHDRFKQFPALTADDLFVDMQFAAGEKAVVHTPPVRVRTPKTTPALRATLRRVYRGQHEFRRDVSGLPDKGGSASRNGRSGSTSRRTLFELLSSIRRPQDAFDACVYVFLVSTARAGAAASAPRMWERDDSSRTASTTGASR